jgi:uncharacterized protein YjbI with pentapeptide repeats
VADQHEESKDKASPPLAASTIVLVLFYTVVIVASHSDLDLIRPDTQVSLKDSSIDLPSGWLFTPFLGLKLPIFWFYLLAPLLVVALHFELLRIRPVTRDIWSVPLRIAGNILAPVALFLMLWKFVPFAHARPNELPGLSAGLALSYFLATMLFLDAALLLYPYLVRSVDAQSTPASWESLRRRGAAIVALRQAGLLWVGTLALATIVEVLLGPNSSGSILRPSGVPASTFIIVATVLLSAAVGLAVPLVRRIFKGVVLFPFFTRRAASREVAPMRIYVTIFAGLLIGLGLPEVGRPLNLSGARLTAAEPSENIMAALIVAGSWLGRPDQDAIRREAWERYGRGLDYTGWKFPNASFDGASMELIRLDRSDLSDAHLIRADLTEASLIGAKLQRTALNEADLSGAKLTCVNNEKCDVFAQDQSSEKKPPNSPSPATPDKTANSDNQQAGGDPCETSRNGPKLDGAKFPGATAENADLSNASLIGAILEGIKSISGTNLKNANLKNAHLAGVKFERVTLTGACLSGADLTGADLTGTDLREAILTDSTLRGAVLRCANLKDTRLPQNLQGVDFTASNWNAAIFAPDSKFDAGILNNVVQQPDFDPKKCLTTLGGK